MVDSFTVCIKLSVLKSYSWLVRPGGRLVYGMHLIIIVGIIFAVGETRCLTRLAPLVESFTVCKPSFVSCVRVLHISCDTRL